LKKYVVVVGLILVFLAVFIPFASSNPDGLEKVAATFGVQEQQPLWSGLIADYSVSVFGNPYVSSFVAGVFGVSMVLLVGLLLGKALAPKNRAVQETR
jgi:cobalt/nickel transport protein